MILVDASGYPGVRSDRPSTNNFVSLWLYRHGNPRLLVRRGFERAVVDTALIDDDFVDRTLSFIRRDGTRDAQLKLARTRDFEGLPTDQLKVLPHPALILWGQHDALVPVANAEKFERDLPNTKVVIYSDLGHMPQIEAPERSARDVLAFLAAADG